MKCEAESAIGLYTERIYTTMTMSVHSLADPRSFATFTEVIAIRLEGSPIAAFAEGSLAAHSSRFAIRLSPFVKKDSPCFRLQKDAVFARLTKGIAAVRRQKDVRHQEVKRSTADRTLPEILPRT